MGRLEQLHGGRLGEVVDEAFATGSSPCRRSARAGAVAQVWGSVCKHAPPLPSSEGVDALSDIAEDINKYAVKERCDIVPREQCYAEWMSLPGGTVGGFNVMRQLPPERRKVYQDLRKVLVDEKVATEGAALTGAYVGIERGEYVKLIRRMLEIGMVKLRRKVKVVNGIFGVWKTRPVRGRGKAPDVGGGGEG